MSEFKINETHSCVHFFVKIIIIRFNKMKIILKNIACILLIEALSYSTIVLLVGLKIHIFLSCNNSNIMHVCFSVSEGFVLIHGRSKFLKTYFDSQDYS